MLIFVKIKIKRYHFLWTATSISSLIESAFRNTVDFLAYSPEGRANGRKHATRTPSPQNAIGHRVLAFFIFLLFFSIKCHGGA